MEEAEVRTESSFNVKNSIWNNKRTEMSSVNCAVNCFHLQPRKVFGYFALGVLLGLLVGGVIAAILVLVIIKCCDKGKMAPYYMVSFLWYSVVLQD